MDNDDKTRNNNVVMFNACKKEKYYLNNGFKKLSRRLRSSCAVEVNKDSVVLDRLKESNVMVFAGSKERFTSTEFQAVNDFVKDGGSALFMLNEECCKDSNVNMLLKPYGISMNNDNVVRTVYYKYLHPKEVFISNGVINREIARVATLLGSKQKDLSKSNEQEPAYNNNKPDDAEKDHQGLSFVYPYGVTMNVSKPSIPILSSGFISFPMNRPVAAVWQDGGLSAPPQGSGRIVVMGSVDIFSDEWLEKEENGKLQEIIFKWLLRDEHIHLDLIDAEDPDLSEYNHLPDTEALSERFRSCLQESEELPQDFTKLFDTELFKYDTSLVPEAIELHQQLGIKPETLTLIPPQFECPLPPLKPAVFPPTLSEAAPPALDQYDLDEHFASEHLRLAQLTNKCTDSDLEYYIKESGTIMGISSKLPEDQREAKHVLDHVFRQLINYKKLNMDTPNQPPAQEKEIENHLVFSDSSSFKD